MFVPSQVTGASIQMFAPCDDGTAVVLATLPLPGRPFAVAHWSPAQCDILTGLDIYWSASEALRAYLVRQAIEVHR